IPSDPRAGFALATQHCSQHIVALLGKSAGGLGVGPRSRNPAGGRGLGYFFAVELFSFSTYLSIQPSGFPGPVRLNSGRLGEEAAVDGFGDFAGFESFVEGDTEAFMQRI